MGGYSAKCMELVIEGILEVLRICEKRGQIYFPYSNFSATAPAPNYSKQITR